jgi:hypothetical protein
LAEAIKAPRSSKAFPITNSFFFRASNPRRSSPAIPTPEERVVEGREISSAVPTDGKPVEEVAWDGGGTGGAF